MVNSASVTVHHTNGVQNHRAITALIGLTGNFDRKGGNRVIPTSYYHRATGLQTREHEFKQPRPWEEMAPRIGQDPLFPVWCRMMDEAQATMLPFQIQSKEPYPIRAILGFGLNHRMWPASDFMKESLLKLDFFVDVELFHDGFRKACRHCPSACSSFERNELTIYPSRYAIWTEPVIPPLGQSRPDVDIIVDLAHRLKLQDPLLSQGTKPVWTGSLSLQTSELRTSRSIPRGRFCVIEQRRRTKNIEYRDFRRLPERWNLCPGC